jgi:hypothetical protein
VHIIRTEIQFSPEDVYQMMQTPHGMNALMLLGGQTGQPPLLPPPALIPEPAPAQPPMGTEFNPRPIPQKMAWDLSRLIGMGFAALGIGTLVTVLGWLMISIPHSLTEEATPIAPAITEAIPDLPVEVSAEELPQGTAGEVIEESVEEVPTESSGDNTGNPPPITPTTIPCSIAFC